VTTGTASTVEWPAWEDPGFYMQDPDVIHASMAVQRREAPVYWYEPPGFTTGVWVLSKWEHQRFVGSHPELFSNRYGFAIGDAIDPAAVMDQLPPWAHGELSEPGLTPAQVRGRIARGKLLGGPELENMMLLDPPRHGQVRKVFMRALRPSLVRSLKAHIAELTDEFIDRVEPETTIDFVKTLGRIPAALMTDLIGVPRDMRERFVEMASAHLDAITVTAGKDPEEIERLEQLSHQLHAYCDELLKERRESGGGGDDLVSVIVRSEFDGAPVSRALAFTYITHFIAAGETTRYLLSNLALALAEHPDQRHLLAERPELIPNAIEETLRYYPINWTGCRTATQQVEIGGQTIEKDDYVVMAYASGNRDEDVWERPDDFDVTRSFDKDHLAFGHGEHSCPGALLARVDSGVIWERLLARLPDWELAGTPTKFSTPFLQGLTSLPLRFQA
jgi:cytochrome P450